MSVVVNDVSSIEYVQATRKGFYWDYIRFASDIWLYSPGGSMDYIEVSGWLTKDLEKAYQEYKKGKNETL